MPTSVTESRSQTARLVEQYYRPVWRYLRFLGCSETLADDLAQETFVAILQRPPVLSGPQALSGYLRTVARNLFLKSARESRVEPPSVEPGMLDAVWERVADSSSWDSYREAVKGCLDGLERRDRDLLSRYYGRAGSRATTAAAIGRSEEGLKTTLRRIKGRLKACVRGKLSHE